MTPIIRFVYRFAVERYEYDCELYGWQVGSKMERLSYRLIWPFTVACIAGLLMILTIIGFLLFGLIRVAWHLILTY